MGDDGQCKRHLAIRRPERTSDDVPALATVDETPRLIRSRSERPDDLHPLPQSRHLQPVDLPALVGAAEVKGALGLG